MSSHPGSSLKDAVELSLYLRREHIRPEQVQDFYPTPGTLSTAMYYTGLDPHTMNPVFVPKTPEEKQMQRALLQYFRPNNRDIVIKALLKADRKDLIGNGKNCLVAAPFGSNLANSTKGKGKSGVKGHTKNGRSGNRKKSKLGGKWNGKR